MDQEGLADEEVNDKHTCAVFSQYALLGIHSVFLSLCVERQHMFMKHSFGHKSFNGEFL